MESNQKLEELLIKLDLQLPDRMKQTHLDKTVYCTLFARPSFLTGKHANLGMFQLTASPALYKLDHNL